MTTVEDIHRAELAGMDLYESWTSAYNRQDSRGNQLLLDYPLISFGGGRPTRDSLAFSVRMNPVEEQQPGIGVAYRDTEWGRSTHDNIRNRQVTADKTHLISDIVRYDKHLVPYGVGKSRLQVAIRGANGWRIRALSSCGLRSPDSPEEPDDEEIRSVAEGVVTRVVEAISARSVDGLSAECHFPFARLPGSTVEVVEDGVTLMERSTESPSDEWVRSAVKTVSAFTPQSGDKVVVEVEIDRFDGQGAKLEPEGAICLVVRHDSHWGLQLCSTKGGLTGIA